MSEAIRPVLPEQIQMEERLKNELETAKTAYEAASKQYKRAVKECEERNTATPFDIKKASNGKPLSVSQATQGQHYAFENYKRALKAFNNFLLYHEVPEWPLGGPET